MFDMRFVESAIGVILLFLLVSLIVTTAQEGIASVLKLRASNLYRAIVKLLRNPELAKAVYEHPLILGPYRKERSWWMLFGIQRPSYIPSQAFVVALLDVLKGEGASSTPLTPPAPAPPAPGAPALPAGPKPAAQLPASPLAAPPAAAPTTSSIVQKPAIVQPPAPGQPAAQSGSQLGSELGMTHLLAGAKSIVEGMSNAKLLTKDQLAQADETRKKLQTDRMMANKDLQKVLTLLVDDVDLLATQAKDKAKVVSERLENWFNQAMSRAGGWYKRYAAALSFVLGFGIAAGLNADAAYVAERLWKDASLRASVVAAADAYHSSDVGKNGTATTNLEQRLGELRSSTLPVGWTGREDREWWLMGVGWLMTALAASLGAPFWFDILSRALQLRGSGGKIPATDKDAKKG